MADDVTLFEAMAEFEAGISNGIDVRQFVELHNRLSPDVQAQLRFAAQIYGLKEARETRHSIKKLRADVDALRAGVAFAVGLSVLVFLLYHQVEITIALAGALGAGAVSPFVQLGLAALFYKRGEA